MTISDFEGHVCCFKPLCPSTTASRILDSALAE